MSEKQDWKSGDWAAVRIVRFPASNPQLVEIERPGKPTVLMFVDSLHPLPAMAAEDVGVIEAAEAWATIWFPNPNSHLIGLVPEVADLLAAVRARAKTKEPPHPICDHPTIYNAGFCCGNTPCTATDGMPPYGIDLSNDGSGPDVETDVEKPKFKIGDHVWDAFKMEGVVEEIATSGELGVRWLNGGMSWRSQRNLANVPTSPDAPDPTNSAPAPDVEALREKVVEAARKIRTTYKSPSSDYVDEWQPLFMATDALNAALTPAPVDRVVELREAVGRLIQYAERVEHESKVVEHYDMAAHARDAITRAEAALSALGDR